MFCVLIGCLTSQSISYTVYTKVLRDENAQNFIRNAFLVSFTLSVLVLELSQKYSAINLALFWTLGELIFCHFVKQMFAAHFSFFTDVTA